MEERQGPLMRGLLSIVMPRDISNSEVRSLLLVCSDLQPGVCQVTKALESDFPEAKIAYLAPRNLQGEIEASREVIDVRSNKESPLRLLAQIRKRKFDITVVLMGGGRPYNLLKVASFFTNYRCLLIFNENADAYFLRRGSLKNFYGHLRWRLKNLGVGRAGDIALMPLGFVILCCKGVHWTFRRWQNKLTLKPER